MSGETAAAGGAAQLALAAVRVRGLEGRAALGVRGGRRAGRATLARVLQMGSLLSGCETQLVFLSARRTQTCGSIRLVVFGPDFCTK